MNLKNITIGENISRTSVTFPYIKEYIPVCNLPALSVNSSNIPYERLNTQFPNITEDYDIIKYKYSTLDKINKIKEKYDFFEEIYEEDILDYIQESFSINVSFEARSPRNKSLFHEMFFNDIQLGKVRWSRRYELFEYKNYSWTFTTGTRILVARGGIFIRNDASNRVVPLVMLVVKTDYARDFMFSNIVDYNIDKSKLEWWINDEIESIPTNMLNFITGILKKGNNGNIKVCIKGNMNDYFGLPKIPSFESITDRITFFNNLKHNFKNPDGAVVLDVPKVELIDSNKQFTNKVLNTFVSPIQYNTYKLIE